MSNESTFITKKELYSVIQEVQQELLPEAHTRNIALVQSMIIQGVIRMEIVDVIKMLGMDPYVIKEKRNSDRLDEMGIVGVTVAGLLRASAYFDSPSVFDTKRRKMNTNSSNIRGAKVPEKVLVAQEAINRLLLNHAPSHDRRNQ